MTNNPMEGLERLTAEAKQAAEGAQAEIARIKKSAMSPENIRAYAAQRRARLWHMPAWLWVPLVVALVGMFFLALYVAVW